MQTSQHKSRLESIEIKFLKHIEGKTRRDKLKNTEIRGTLQIKSIEQKIKQGQLRCFGHVNRMIEKRTAKPIYEARPTGKIKRNK